MKLTKLKLFLIVLTSLGVGVLLYFMFSESRLSSILSPEEIVPIELMQIDNIVNSESLEVLDNFKNATLTLNEVSDSSDNKDLIFENYLDMIEEVTLLNEFRIMLDPKNFKCGFNRKLSNRIKSKSGWIPSQIKLSTEDSVKMNKVVLKFKESSSAYIFNLFNVTYKKTDSSGNEIDTTIQAIPPGSLLFKNNKVFNFLNRERSSFIVNFDCDGYYKAAVSAGLGGGKGNVRANAEASQGRKVSSFVGMAYIYSPLQYIMEPASTPINGIIPQYERFSHLASILAITRILEISDFSITPTKQLKMVWSSNTGSSTMNSKVNLSASGGLSFISGSAEGKLSINRGASYDNFNSYLIGKVNSPVGSYSKTKISERMARIFASIEMESLPKWDNRYLIFSIKLNEEYSDIINNEWEIEENGFKVVTITPDLKDRNLCNYKVEGNMNSVVKRITLKGKIENQEVKRVIDLPILD